MSDPCHIAMYYHCGTCLRGKPAGQSPAEWSRTQIGPTRWGFQVWCNRCEKSVIHLDLLGQKVSTLPNNLKLTAKPGYLKPAEREIIAHPNNRIRPKKV